MTIQKTALRLPQDLHQQIIEAARQSGRSMNAEIIARLRITFDALSEKLKFELSENINDLASSEGLTDAQEKRVLELIEAALERRSK